MSLRGPLSRRVSTWAEQFYAFQQAYPVYTDAMIDELLLQDFFAKQQAAARGKNRKFADMARAVRIA